MSRILAIDYGTRRCGIAITDELRMIASGLTTVDTGELMVFLHDYCKEMPDMPVERVDERFSSKMAVQAMIDSGLKKKKRQNKALIDEISATIILQDYLNTI